jgi:hypothetical protein
VNEFCIYEDWGSECVELGELFDSLHAALEDVQQQAVVHLPILLRECDLLAIQVLRMRLPVLVTKRLDHRNDILLRQEHMVGSRLAIKLLQQVLAIAANQLDQIVFLLERFQGLDRTAAGLGVAVVAVDGPRGREEAEGLDHLLVVDLAVFPHVDLVE